MAVCLCLVLAAGEPLTFAAGGRTDYVIYLAPDAPPADVTAADELAGHLEAVTGASFAIVREEPDGPAIRLGSAAGVEVDRLGHDGIVMRTSGRDLLLAGRPPRGTLYAVYTFLEELVGVRWWSSSEATIPRRERLVIGPLAVEYAPPLRVREAFYRDAQEGIYSARLKLNGHFHRVPAEYGGHYSILGWCHTFYQLLPPDQYFAEHPEWYSERGGERSVDGGQLCLTNDAMREELTRRALEWIRREPEAGMISISQNDWHGACQCAACQAVVAEEGSESGPLIRFVNAVAEAIEAEYPDFLVETLAYQYTRSAPRVTHPRDNVVVRLCSIECSFSQPLETGEQNEPFARDMTAWSAVAPKLYVWNYVTNFAAALLPHPNLTALAPDIRSFVNHHTIGLFEQGDAYCLAGDFVRLRAWLLAHLMWDPTRDEQALLDEFLRGYYGAAAPHLRAYLDLREQAVRGAGYYLRCYHNDTAGWLDLAAMNRAEELFAAAQAAVADDEALSARVDRERLSLDLAWLTRYDALRREARAAGVPFGGPADPVAAVRDFLERCERYEVDHYGEGRPFAPYAEVLARRFRPPGPPPDEVAGLPADSWVDVQDHQFQLHGAGDWVTLTDDAAASDGVAARMPGGHTQWAAQVPITSDLAAPGRWRVLLRVRCDAVAEAGEAMTLGVWHGGENRSLAQRTVSIEEAGGGYVTIDLGPVELGPGVYVWAAPMGDAGAVEAVWVDRVVLVRVADE